MDFTSNSKFKVGKLKNKPEISKKSKQGISPKINLETHKLLTRYNFWSGGNINDTVEEALLLLFESKDQDLLKPTPREK